MLRAIDIVVWSPAAPDQNLNGVAVEVQIAKPKPCQHRLVQFVKIQVKLANGRKSSYRPSVRFYPDALVPCCRRSSAISPLCVDRQSGSDPIALCRFASDR